MLDKPYVTLTEEQLTAVVHLRVSRDEIKDVMDVAIQEVLSALAAEGVKPTGPCFSFHFKRPTDTFDFEVGFPVGSAVVPRGRVKMSTLPAGMVACKVYRGPYEGLGAAWGQLFAWMESERLSGKGSLWESYVSGPESTPDPQNWRTELNCPLGSRRA